jgi:hypothetical protein
MSAPWSFLAPRTIRKAAGVKLVRVTLVQEDDVAHRLTVNVYIGTDSKSFDLHDKHTRRTRFRGQLLLAEPGDRNKLDIMSKIRKKHSDFSYRTPDTPVLLHIS